MSCAGNIKTPQIFRTDSICGKFNELKTTISLAC